MTKRMWVLLACLGLVAILALVYGYLAFAPTGYKKFREERLAVIEETLESIELPRMEVALPTRAIDTVPNPVGVCRAGRAIPASHGKEPDIAPLQNPFNSLSRVPKNIPLVGILGLPSIISKNLFSSGVAIYLSREDFELAADGRELKPREEVVQRLLSTPTFSSGTSEWLAESEVDKDLLHKNLEIVDWVLLQPSFDYHRLHEAIFHHQYPNLAITRAAIQGDREKAALLLQGYLCILGREHTNGFPQWFSFYRYERLLALVLVLVEMDCLTSDDLLPAIEVLEQTVLSREEKEALNTKRIFNIVEEEVQGSAPGISDAAAYEALPKWAYESVKRMTMKPVLKRQTEKAVMAWLGGDDEQAMQIEKRIIATGRIMKLMPGESPVSRHYFPYGIDHMTYDRLSREILNQTAVWRRVRSALDTRNRGQGHNESVLLTLLGFATARYRSEHGEYPVSVDDLVPDYLDEKYYRKIMLPDNKWIAPLAIYFDKSEKPFFCLFRRDESELIGNCYSFNMQAFKDIIEERINISKSESEEPLYIYAESWSLYKSAIPEQTLELLRQES